MALDHAGDVDYPTTDGRPMAETDIHRDQMVDLIQTLQNYYADRDDVYVSGNILLYYVKGDKRKHISPDVMVVYGVPKHKRDYYLLWNEGQPPHVVIEITSSSTRHEDMVKKKKLYLDMGVREYYAFDPFRDYIRAHLRGWRNVDGRWVPMLTNQTCSNLLGLDLRVQGEELRLIEPESRRVLPTQRELVKSLQSDLSITLHVAEQAAELAKSQTNRAIAELQRAEAESRRAEAESRRAESEKQRADAEHALRLQYEAELKRLRQP